MKQHVFQTGEDIEAIARQYGFRLPATIWDHPSNDRLRELRKSAYALAAGDTLTIPDLQVKSEDASDERRHVFRLRGLTRPAFYSRLVPDPELTVARFGPVFAQPGAVGYDVSFAPHLAAALAHAASAHESARFQAVFAGRGPLAEAGLLQSVAFLLVGDKAAWVADALARYEQTDLRTLLTWVANVLGFPCDPAEGPQDLAQGVAQALRRLRAASNIQARALLYYADLQPRPPEDWASLFDAIDERLRASLNLSKDALAAARKKVQFLSPLWVDLTRSDGIEGTNPPKSLDLVLFDDQVVKATPGRVHPLLAKPAAFIYTSLAPKMTATTFDPLRPDLLEFEDVHFGAGRSVLLPTELTAAGPDEDWGLTGIDVLVAALRHATDHPDRTILVTGHTDSTGSKGANFDLSKRRAESVRMMMKGMHVVEAWAELSAKNGVAEDAWEYLRWSAERLGYDCWPSPADAPNPAQDAKALLAFRRRYNQDVADFAAIAPKDNPYHPAFTRPLNLRGPLIQDDWRAFFEMVQKYLVRQLRMPMRELLELQANLNFGSEGLGCGESHPFDTDERERRRLTLYEDQDLGESSRDRRVEVLFLDPDEAALLSKPLLCHPTPGAAACKPELCMLYDQKFFEFHRLTAVPQRGKIELIERTVMRDSRLFTDEEVELVEEHSGDFTPILGESARILVRVTPPYVPFEGEVGMTIGRRTNDEENPISRVATIRWRDADGSRTVTLTKPTLLVFEWDGLATHEVPREYSDRQIHDEIQDKKVFIPMMEMEPGKRAKHGPYVIERVQLFAKDETVSATYAPDEGEQNELVMVVQPTIEIAFYDHGKLPHELKNLLHEVGFGKSILELPVAFPIALEHATVRRVIRYCAQVNLRFVATNGRPETDGLTCHFNCYPLGSPGSDTVEPTEDNGTTYQFVLINGERFFQNLFLLFDQHNVPPSRGRQSQSEVHTRALLFSTRSNLGNGPREAALNVFGRVGFPSDRRLVHRIVKNPSAVAKQRDEWSFEGGFNSPRTVHGDEVLGLVDDTDAANSTVTVDASTGLVAISTTNPALVPPRRASDIARAINACAAWLSYIAAHELGHMLGASVTQSEENNAAGVPRTLAMPDGSSAGPYMDQDEAGEDPKPASHYLMSPSAHSFAQRLGLTGPAMTFRVNQAAYLRAVAPFAADFSGKYKA
jgi:hypothetical protein